MSNLVGLCLSDDIVKVSIYYFSRLPMTQSKTKFNRCFGPFYGVILILASILAVGIQFTCLYYQWQSVLDGNNVYERPLHG